MSNQELRVVSETQKAKLADFLLVIALMIGAGAFGAFIALVIDPDCHNCSTEIED